MKIPPAPGISPREMNILRIVCSLAWSDGELSEQEQDVMLSEFSHLFAEDEDTAHDLKDELREYISQNIPLEELVPKLQNKDDRELVLKLGYMVIRASRRTADEPLINMDEKAAFRKLLDLLALPNATVEEIEWAADEDLEEHHDVIGTFSAKLGDMLGH